MVKVDLNNLMGLSARLSACVAVVLRVVKTIRPWAGPPKFLPMRVMSPPRLKGETEPAAPEYCGPSALAISQEMAAHMGISAQQSSFFGGRLDE
ncbi:hypothetical protein [Hymenobacter properus]|uniref:Uncharacterized protein n=1 Tax=Hymenobacter properus TaxID=2791026 RepID=A0A931BDV0_9BACT|nr:hypothetical protein [Hymenobacter properus]MBF9140736.1 hypothetical protein [Hymenobacter properus]MBR7719544.1 hypothetical protein [Microvirga sp. SRT04]